MLPALFNTIVLLSGSGRCRCLGQVTPKKQVIIACHHDFHPGIDASGTLAKYQRRREERLAPANPTPRLPVYRAGSDRYGDLPELVPHEQSQNGSGRGAPGPGRPL